jgi:hypothetical protein
VGKPLGDSRWEVGMVADVFHFYAGAVEKHYGDTIPVACPGTSRSCSPAGSSVPRLPAATLWS